MFIYNYNNFIPQIKGGRAAEDIFQGPLNDFVMSHHCQPGDILATLVNS